jgi:hypothetical protein
VVVPASSTAYFVLRMAVPADYAVQQRSAQRIALPMEYQEQCHIGQQYDTQYAVRNTNNATVVATIEQP